MKVYLDDERETPIGWHRVWTVEELITLLSKDTHIKVISLDHDLGENQKTGYDFLKWFAEKVFSNKWKRPIPEFRLHTANPVGRQNMLSLINVIMREVNYTNNRKNKNNDYF